MIHWTAEVLLPHSLTHSLTRSLSSRHVSFAICNYRHLHAILVTLHAVGRNGSGKSNFFFGECLDGWMVVVAFP
jgi:hypothetical protein